MNPHLEALLLRGRVENFIYAEAALLDAWDLDGWLALYASECRYEITPTGIANAAELSSETSLFLVSDDRFRLEQRVIRLKKPTAHAEYPHSRTRHLYSNVRVLGREDDLVRCEVNFVTYRTNKGTTHQFIGSLRYQLREIASEGAAIEQFQVVSKRATLDLENLVPQGRVTVIL